MRFCYNQTASFGRNFDIAGEKSKRLQENYYEEKLYLYAQKMIKKKGGEIYIKFNSKYWKNARNRFIYGRFILVN